MNVAVAPRFGRVMVCVLSVGIGLAAVVLVWLGYAGNRQWERSVAALAEQGAAETVDLMELALNRDMCAVQRSVLESRDWEPLPTDDRPDARTIAASAFARYPYPESFFIWRSGTSPADMIFLARLDRRPAWIVPDNRAREFPVVTGISTWTAKRLLDRLRPDAAAGKAHSVFSLSIDGVPYHAVARHTYQDFLHLRPAGVVGFLVNLDWARRVYFPEITAQVSQLRPKRGTRLAIVDERGSLVAGTQPEMAQSITVSRRFPLLFCDPMIVAVDPAADIPTEWTIEADARPEPTFATAIRNADRTLVGAVAAAAVLGLGLLLTGLALRSGARLAQMRSDFVSTVTHELKTPIATIRAAGDTLAQGRLADPEKQRLYADLVVRESKRLSRLVDNVLAWARVTDEQDVYSFTSIDPFVLVDDVLRDYQRILDDGGFHVEVTAEADLPCLRGDRTALGLALSNLVDNAIRYSGNHRSLTVTTRSQGRSVCIAITDCGYGIPADELERVRRRFVRGTNSSSSGSGLGLAIADRVAMDHGGTLTIRSVVGEGTTATLLLPVSEASDEETCVGR